MQQTNAHWNADKMYKLQRGMAQETKSILIRVGIGGWEGGGGACRPLLSPRIFKIQ